MAIETEMAEGSGENRSLTGEEIREFLSRPVVARLATVRPDGSPYIAPVWQEYDGEVMWIIPRERSVFVQHIQHNPRVAVSVAVDQDPLTRVLILGRAEIVEGPKPMEGLIGEIGRRMAVRYLGEHDMGYANKTWDRPRYLVKIIPEKVISWTGSEWAKKYVD
jgi:PPOX class probable F420-dependent enzyme